jgi:hypothetical protein
MFLYHQIRANLENRSQNLDSRAGGQSISGYLRKISKFADEDLGGTRLRFLFRIGDEGYRVISSGLNFTQYMEATRYHDS